ncbi:MAG: DUF637 domain-containing protein [Pseudomonadota bacterium]
MDSKLTALNSIVNNGGQIIGDGALEIRAGGEFVNLSGGVQTQDDLSVIAERITSRTLVHRIESNGQLEERFGTIASINSGGDIYLASGSDVLLLGTSMAAAGGIAINANGNVIISSISATNTSENQNGSRYVSTSSVEHLMSSLTAEETISLIAGGQIIIDASEIVSNSGHIEILAELGITIEDELSASSYSSGNFENTNDPRIEAYKTVAIRSLLDAGKGIRIHSELGDITLQAADIRSQEGASVSASNGQINLLMTLENDHYSYSEVKENFFTTTTINRGHTIDTAVHTTVVGGLVTDALYGLNVEYEGKFDDNGNPVDLDGQIAALSQMPGLEWMADVRAQTPDVDWTAIETQYEVWNETNRSLSPAFSAVISIAIAVVSGGAGTAGLSFWQAAVTAGAASLESQLIIALANGAVNGDIGGAMEDLASADTFRSLAVTMITAGAMAEINTEFFNVASGAELSFTEQAVQAVTDATVNASVSSLVLDGDFDNFSDSFVQSLGQHAINTLGKHMAKTIGDAFDVEGAESMQTALKYISHAASGCVLGIANDGLVNDTETETGNACAIGAGGAVIGELIATQYRDSEEIKEAQRATDELIEGHGEDLEAARDRIQSLYPEKTRAEINQMLMEELNSLPEVRVQTRNMEELAQRGVDLARLGSALGAFAAGASAAGVNSAADIGEITAENNGFWLAFSIPAILTAIDVYMTGQDIIEIVEAYERGDTAEGNRLLAIMAGGAAIGAFVPGDKILDSVVKFLKEKNYDFGRRFDSIMDYVSGSLDVPSNLDIYKLWSKDVLDHAAVGEFDDLFRLKGGMHTEQGFKYFLDGRASVGTNYSIENVTSFGARNDGAFVLMETLSNGIRRVQLPRDAWATKKAFENASIKMPSGERIKGIKTLWPESFSADDVVSASQSVIQKNSGNTTDRFLYGSYKGVEVKLIRDVDTGMIKTVHPTWNQ